MGHLAIERISADEATASFLARFYAEERPVIIEGVITPEALVERLSSAERVRALESQKGEVRAVEPGWLDMTTGVLGGLYAGSPLEKLVESLIPRDIRFRRTCMRVFAYAAGHITPWHYDGNGIHVLNLCVQGRKHWQLVSPHTPLAYVPFKIGALQHYMPLTESQREHLDWMEFDCRQGDLLFVPRGWAHFVVSLDPWNSALTWVFTPRGEASTSTGRREMVNLLTMRWLRRSPLWPALPAWLKAHVEEETEAEEFEHRVAAMSDEADLATLARGVLDELRRLPPRPRRVLALRSDARREALSALSCRPRPRRPAPSSLPA